MEAQKTNTQPSRNVRGAAALLHEIRDLLDDIAQSSTILGATPFAGREAAHRLAGALHTALLEYEIDLAKIGLHEFDVKRDA